MEYYTELHSVRVRFRARWVRPISIHPLSPYNVRLGPACGFVIVSGGGNTSYMNICVMCVFCSKSSPGEERSDLTACERGMKEVPGPESSATIQGKVPWYTMSTWPWEVTLCVNQQSTHWSG